MSKEELAKERAETEARLRELQKAEAEFDGRRLKEMKADIEKMLAAEGFTMADLFAGRAPKKAGGGAKAPAKYRHPENASKTWSGRGRQPQWFKDHIDGGGKAEDLSV
ncbi:H-NS histone family protein [uncultured Jannaschia sp.]|uniref:H-NS histone family protein n=1 Tax=uncultured Jannaschia sp. TaxID=293347 RepID=UPI0026200639|nr:H-NS histone family protein [uncultured Jannaschia sp.]